MAELVGLSLDTDRILQYILPVAYVIILTLTVVNIKLLLQQDAFAKPSHFLYLNMLILDLTVASGGICAHISIETDGKTSKRSEFCLDVIFILNLYSGVLLLLGLGICRVISIKSGVFFYIEHGLKISRWLVFIAWTEGFLTACLRATFFREKTIFIVINNGIFIIAAITTIFINLYILINVRSTRGRIGQIVYERAAKTALLLFLNASFWHALYVIRDVAILYVLATTGELSVDCTSENWMKRIIICGFIRDSTVRHLLQFIFILESLCNNLILLYQQESRVLISNKWHQITNYFQRSYREYSLMV